MKKIMLMIFVWGIIFSSNVWTCRGQQTPKESGNDITKTDEKNSQESLRVTDEDKFQIIKSILEQTPQIKRRTLLETTEKNLVIKLSEKNIGSKFLPKFSQVEFVLLTADDIKNYEGISLNYWEFEYFKAERYKITVFFSVIGLGRGFFPTKYQTTYECRKGNEKWTCKAVGYAIHN